MNLLCYCWSCWWRKLWTQTEEAKNLYILAYSERWSYPRSRFHRPYQQNRHEMMIKMVAITFKNRFNAFHAHCPSSQFQCTSKKKKKIQIGSNFFKNVWSGFSLLIIQSGQLLARWSSNYAKCRCFLTHFDAYRRLYDAFFSFVYLSNRLIYPRQVEYKLSSRSVTK